MNGDGLPYVNAEVGSEARGKAVRTLDWLTSLNSEVVNLDENRVVGSKGSCSDL